MKPLLDSDPHRGRRNLWSLDEFIVVGDLYLRRGRSSGVGDREVVELARLTGRSPASISRRLGNFDGTVRPGMGLKPIIGEPLRIFNAMNSDDVLRRQVVAEARGRLLEMSLGTQPEVRVPHLVDPESLEIEETDVSLPGTTRRMIRAEARLVRRFRDWLDPVGTRLRGLVIPVEGRALRADLYDTELDLLIEAKADSHRDHVRYAIGQLFDYRRYLASPPALAILVPHRLTVDLEALPIGAGVAVIWASGDGFVDSTGGELTTRILPASEDRGLPKGDSQ